MLNWTSIEKFYLQNKPLVWFWVILFLILILLGF